MPSATLRTLLTGLIDYAGLFPPAALSMTDAVRNYATYRESPDGWALGRFVVPTARLDELVAAAQPHASGPWHVSALVGDDVQHDADTIHSWNAANRGRFIVDAAEVRGSATAARQAARALGDDITLYVEIPVGQEPNAMLQDIRTLGARAKMRTGGLTTGAFPCTEHVARFIAGCVELAIPFKVTAGLHHALRADYRLTYEPDSETGTMFGFLNLFVASAFAHAGATRETIERILEERSHDAFAFDDDEMSWRGQSLTLDALGYARSSLAIAFGSCSFREPLDDLRLLGLL